MSAVAVVIPEDGSEKGIDIAWIKSLDIVQTKKLIDEDIEAIEKHGMRLGMLILHAQELGEDVSALMRRPVLKAARNVALGFLAVEAFSAFHANKEVLHRLVDLPKERQIELVKEVSVPICEIVGKETTHRQRDIARLTKHEADLFFNKHEHRTNSIEEQAQKLSSKIIEEKIKKNRASFVYDDKAGTVDCKNATGDQIREYLKKHGL